MCLTSKISEEAQAALWPSPVLKDSLLGFASSVPHRDADVARICLIRAVRCHCAWIQKGLARRGQRSLASATKSYLSGEPRGFRMAN